MANFQSTNYTTALSPATSSAGIQGGDLQIRSTVAAGKSQVILDSYTVPASAGPAAGDTVQWFPTLTPTDTLKRITLYWDALGAGCTVSLGKQDPNNSANTDAVHYMGATSAAVAGSADGNLNLWEQVGTDPAGDQSTGNTAPGFGALPIVITTTFGGASPTASAVIKIVAEYVSGT